MPLDHSPISRRTVAKGAAWSVPAVAVAGSAPALAASPTCCEPGMQSVSKTLTYTAQATSPISLPQGTWTVTVSTDLPTCVKVGDPIPAPTLTVKVETSQDTMGGLDLLSIVSVEGTGTSPYSIAGAVVDPGNRTTTLTIPSTDVPTDGTVLTTTGTGTGAAETAAAAPGTITVTIGDSFTANLTGTQSTGGTVNLVTEGTLQDGQDATLGTITVTEC